ncbi:MAG TPA: hypothetical protein PKD12_07960 [Nitrospira sp.]|nr:hypothetical protein [Nitrospira sp.]
MPERSMLDFSITRESKVSWFDMRQLTATAVKSLAATIVGPMTGRREIMAALAPAAEKIPEYTPDSTGALWLDYIADTGEGWNATHSVMWLAGRDGLALSPDGKPTPQPIPSSGFQEGLPSIDGTIPLPHGKVLIFGGDQVYPTASAVNYKTRFSDVMRSARSWQQPPRDLFAIPGNHDWYDGLTNFIRLFCQTGDGRRWFGAWRSKQRRSYFTIKLPYGWWLWGLDLALDDDLDPPQLDYFVSQARLLRPGDRVIVCVPSPSWLKQDPGNKQLTKLDIILNLITGKDGKSGKSVPVILTGDLHYYARHEAHLSDGLRQFIICGGGGAFGLGTTQTPSSIRVNNFDSEPAEGKLQRTFPDKQQSFRARRGVFGFPLVNRAFSALLGATQTVFLWLLSSPPAPVAADQLCGIDFSPSWIAAYMCAPFTTEGLLAVFGFVVVRLGSPGILITLAILILVFGLFAVSGKPHGRRSALAWAIGCLHGVSQCALGIASIWMISHAAWMLLGGDLPVRMLIACLSFLQISFLGGVLFAAYLFLTHKFLGMHDQEVFSAQGIEQFKSFLRIRIDPEGLLIYPIGLLKPASEWVLVQEVKQTSVTGSLTGAVTHQLLIPKECRRIFDPASPLAPHLIEPPIKVAGHAAQGDRNAT